MSLNLLTDSVRRAENILGSPVKVCQQEERQMADVSRKSIVMKVAAKAGTILSVENLCIKRPGTGLSQSFLVNYMG